jgi:hydrogenase/urease accessory protein HupE
MLSFTLRIACLLFLLLSDAQAHLMPAGQGTIRIIGDSAYVLIAVPVTALAGFDDNGDKRLGLHELNVHRHDLGRQVNALMQLSASGEQPQLVFEDLLLPHSDQLASEGAEHVVVMRRYQWGFPLQSLQVTLSMFDRAAPPEGQLALRVLRGDATEVAVLSKHRFDHAFFAGKWETVRSYVRLGAEHILLGADHLLFLLTVLIAGAGWRYWLAMTATFTVAHSITLSLAALGWVQAPPSVIEPLIAASIILLAADTLLRGTTAAKQRLALVFACGLLHGMGIASILADLGLSSYNRIVALIAFNAGVEVGQLAFVAIMLALLALIRRCMPHEWHGNMIRVFSLLAALVAAGWVIERTLT